MATKTTTKDGVWSDTTVWGGSKPANGDTININHHIIFDDDMGAMANGILNMAIGDDKCFSFKKDAVTHFKWSGQITGYGDFQVAALEIMTGFTLADGKSNTYVVDRTNEISHVEEGIGWLINYVPKSSIAEVEAQAGSYYHDTENNKLYIHTSDSSNPSTKTIAVFEPLNRPDEGTTVRATITYTGTNIAPISTSTTFCIAGWKTEVNDSALADDYNSGSTDIVLKTGLDLQNGDTILIGQGTTPMQMTEAPKGLYSVTAFDSESKRVTITPALASDRSEGDIVALHSRTVNLIQSNKPTYASTDSWAIYNIKGCLLKQAMPSLFNGEPWGLYNDGLTFENATPFFYQYSGLKAKNVTVYQSTSSSQLGKVAINGELENVAIVNGLNLFNGSAHMEIHNLVAQNIGSAYVQAFYYGSDINIHDSVLRNLNKLGIDCRNIQLHNTIVDEANEVIDVQYYRDVNIESFDHNRIEGNYAAWCGGGSIETLTIDGVVQPGHLIFKPVSADYPVFRDFPFLAPANRTVKFPVTITKDTAGILMKLEIIDPANDPLIDTNAVALATTTAANSTGEQQIGINHKSTVAKQLILRVSCTAASGEVNIDVTRIEQAMAAKLTAI